MVVYQNACGTSIGTFHGRFNVLPSLVNSELVAENSSKDEDGRQFSPTRSNGAERSGRCAKKLSVALYMTLRLFILVGADETTILDVAGRI